MGQLELFPKGMDGQQQAGSLEPLRDPCPQCELPFMVTLARFDIVPGSGITRPGQQGPQVGARGVAKVEACLWCGYARRYENREGQWTQVDEKRRLTEEEMRTVLSPFPPLDQTPPEWESPYGPG